MSIPHYTDVLAAARESITVDGGPTEMQALRALARAMHWLAEWRWLIEQQVEQISTSTPTPPDYASRRAALGWDHKRLTSLYREVGCGIDTLVHLTGGLDGNGFNVAADALVCAELRRLHDADESSKQGRAEPPPVPVPAGWDVIEGGPEHGDYHDDCVYDDERA